MFVLFISSRVVRHPLDAKGQEKPRKVGEGAGEAEVGGTGVGGGDKEMWQGGGSDG